MKRGAGYYRLSTHPANAMSGTSVDIATPCAQIAVIVSYVRHFRYLLNSVLT